MKIFIEVKVLFKNVIHIIYSACVFPSQHISLPFKIVMIIKS